MIEDRIQARLRQPCPHSNLQLLTSNLWFGGDEESRTPDPLLARQVLYQLSYTPAGSLRSLLVPQNKTVYIGIQAIFRVFAWIGCRRYPGLLELICSLAPTLQSPVRSEST